MLVRRREPQRFKFAGALGVSLLAHLLFVAGTAVVLAACSDSNDGGGAPFNAEGTSNDVNAVSATFNSPAMSSLGWAASGMDAVFGAPIVKTSPS